MAHSIPKTTKQWNVTSQDGQGGFNVLKLSNAPVPELGASQVLVKLQAASLNYRDLIIPLGKYPFKTSPNVIPGSDGAGTVIAVGSQVSRFKPGDKVVTLFNQEHIGGPLTPEAAGSGLGGAIDGTLRSVGAFNEQGLVHQPKTLSAVEAATLPCAGLTAWNALYGLSDNRVTAGQWVLTQGSGGVSIFALQFAKAAGARVIATTSSDAKAASLRALGADHVINYRENPEWGAEARKITGGVGVDHIVEVIGPSSMAQGLQAIKIGGVISIIGFVGGEAQVQPGFLDCLMNLCTARGLMVGSRAQMEEMCRAIEANPKMLQPVVDKKLFKLEDVKAAYEYQWSGKHVGKVCIEIA
ncbi:Zinc-type alcohol dehydrogenase-like protein [Beauveria bassiana]|uniref:Zinc-binding dehydrogenase n=1 Tax=Beauveria bassiana (strain ARSEF 2860) TaxID=655819 RepID=J5JZ18_BEAB2|nr:zinc-binding dehydrogenase [Beauveria bassiana ARSEF 2860]EJP69648.1 zinc-binding dehydrogenase [Beauveria bassiana ARSEF 2860]KAH8718472.1 Zinc-type alcohol dehydrogenase-like protein [Beauveria bassiana]